MTTRLYYVSAMIDLGDDDGDTNFDLFVIANTPQEAVELWRKHYREDQHDRDPDETEEEWEEQRAIKKDTVPQSIYECPSDELLARVPRAIAWTDIVRHDLS